MPLFGQRRTRCQTGSAGSRCIGPGGDCRAGASAGTIAANRRTGGGHERFQNEGTAMMGTGRISLSGDDGNLPDDERAVLERARALIPRLAERAAQATAARRLPPQTVAEYH